MAQITQQELQFPLNGMTLAAQRWSSGEGVPVLALHGWLDNSATFARLAPLLSGLDLVAIDMAGHGQSDWRPGGGAYSLWDDIQDVLAVAESLGWDNFFLLGHSRGAIISTLTAASFPQHVRGLALIDGLVPEPVPVEQAPLQLANALRGLKVHKAKVQTVYPSLEQAIVARQKGLFPLGYDAARELTRRGVKPVDGGYSWSSDPRLLAPSPIKLSAEQVRAFVHAVNCPNRLLLAAEGIPKIHPDFLQELVKFPQFDYEILAGGHHLHLEARAELVAARFQDFFDRYR